MKVANILLPVALHQEFSYLYGDMALHQGDIVKVPFGGKQTFGLFRGYKDTTLDSKKLKAITQATKYHFSPPSMSFLDFVADYNMLPRGLILKMMLSAPDALSDKQFRPRKTSTERITETAVLTKHQQDAFEGLSAYGADGFAVSVLKGVTGSGKTEVYLELAKQTIAAGKQVLILLPEILLTTQLIERFRMRLECEVTEWHSALTPAARADTWRRVHDNKVSLIAGARSALFLPFHELGLIIVDEEHEPSFKQEEGGCYHARDMAIARAKFHNIPILLSSATPSIETEQNIRLSKYHCVLLESRYGNAQMPNIKVIDLLKHKPSKGKWISDTLREKMLENFSIEKQALLYINRRGYSMVTLCADCRHKISCPHCDFNLVKHKSRDILLCHYCGHTQSTNTACQNCRSTERFADVGPGVERIAEEVESFLPEARVLVLSSDMLTTRTQAQEAVAAISNHEIDVIIGTQMVTKGLHFPKLDLVGVVDADLSLFSGDIRAVERTYQILKQVSGRAGRESGQGDVYLQTLQPESYLIESITNGDWQNFVDIEIENRRVAHMPPFSRIIMVGLSGKSHELLAKAIRQLVHSMPHQEGVRFLGPSTAPLAMLKGRMRYRFIVVANKDINAQKLVRIWLDAAQPPKSIEVRIDVDPLSFI